MNKYEPPKMGVLNEETVEKIKLAFDQISLAVNNFIENIIALGEKIAASVCVYMNAYVWAVSSRPEWTKILNRTKKSRIKEKYWKRILREYRKQREAAIE